ncbi:MAG: anhydro-N-acetylmuramic acid kinase [Rickettsiales bacterium]
MTSTIQFPTYVIGLMSGTSADGVDAALLFTDGRDIAQPHESAFVPYDEPLRVQILALMQGQGDEAAIAAALTEVHVAAVEALLAKTSISRTEIKLIGFHGQTIRHDPAQGITRQIGDAALLAARTGIAVVADFRSNDVAHGGQGAPLVPLYHAALARDLPKPLMVVNIGGVSNVTWIGSRIQDSGFGIQGKIISAKSEYISDNEEIKKTNFPESRILNPESSLLAFDCGPGNALVDDWVHRHTGKRYDENGDLAGTGTLDSWALQQFMQDPFFALPPPKSLDRNHFQRVVPPLMENVEARGGAMANSPAAIADGAATLTMMTARAIAQALAVVPAAPLQILVAGGGRHNHTLMEFLRRETGLPVLPVEEMGWNGDMLEAEAFAYLAARSVQGLPLSLPTTTGVSEPLTGGQFFSVEEHHHDDDDDCTSPRACCR